MANFSTKTSKRESPDKTDFTCHTHLDMTEVAIPDSWKDRDEVLCMSIDPGIVNLCFRIERRKLYGILDNVEVLLHANISFQKLKTNEHSISRIYGAITSYIMEFKELLNELDLVLIERQMKVNYQSVRVSQHLITCFQTLLWNSPKNPLIMEIDAKVKSKVLAPKGIHQKVVKDWAVEKALQLCFLRRDWESFHNILWANKNKRDDLSDVIVQLEAAFKHLSLSITPIPVDWDALPPYAGWQPGMIFFRELGNLIGVDKIAINVGGWIKILQSNERVIRQCGNDHIVNEDNRLIYAPVRQFKFNKMKSSTEDLNMVLPITRKFSFRS
jgi:hypothetical protein